MPSLETTGASTRAVFESLLKEVDRDPSLAFGIHLGDMVMRPTWTSTGTFFQEVRQNFHKPLLSVIGNHELYGERGLELYHEIFGPDDYAFQIDRNYFIVVDDAAKEGMDPEQLRWLEAELQKSQAARTRLVFLHVPSLTPGVARITTACSPELASRLLVLFKKYKVTHVFAAHIHGYYLGDLGRGALYHHRGGRGQVVRRRAAACLLSLLESDHPGKSGPNPGSAYTRASESIKYPDASLPRKL